MFDFLEKGHAWKCISSVSYRGFCCSGLAYSMDGSLVAVGFGEIVTAWSPETCELKCSLKHSINKGEIKFIEFGNENQCHLLVSASNEQMSVWNLLNLSMTWTVSIRVSLLVADPLSTYIAVFTSDKKSNSRKILSYNFVNKYFFSVLVLARVERNSIY